VGTNLWLPFQVQLDASGSGTAEVGAPALGFNWQAFVTFGTAPSGQSFTVSVLGQVVASGGRQSGPFAAGSGNTVTVTVSGGPASSTVNGVVQGAINQGVAAQAPLPSSGSIIEISGGNVNIVGGKVTIQAGQNGVNVSTETPPQALGSIVGDGTGTASLTATPPAGATGLRVLVYGAASSYPVGGVDIVGSTSGLHFIGDVQNLDLTSAAAFDGECNGDFESVTATISAVGAGSFPSGQVMGQLFALFGGEAVTPVNSPSQPLAVGTGLVGGNVSPWPIDSRANPLVSPMGTQGQGAAVQTVKEPGWVGVKVGYSSSAGTSQEVIAPQPGYSIIVHGVHLSANSSAFAEADLQSPSGTAIGAHSLWEGNAFDIEDMNVPLPADEGLYIYTSAAATILGTITYSVVA
jgi:hypothetical protein